MSTQKKPRFSTQINRWNKELNKYLKDKHIYVSKDLLESTNYQFYKGERRCMARVWRDEKDRNPDINHRCRCKCSDGETDLCEDHARLESDNEPSWQGRVTSRPSPHLIQNYAKRLGNDKNIDYEQQILSKINLTDHSEFKENIKMIGEIRLEKTEPKKNLLIKFKIRAEKISKDKNNILYNSSMILEQSSKIIDTIDTYELKEDCKIYDYNYKQIEQTIIKLAFEEKANSNSNLNDENYKKDKLKLMLNEMNCKDYTCGFVSSLLQLFNKIISEITIPTVSDTDSQFENIKSEPEKSCNSPKLDKEIPEDIYSGESLRFIDQYQNYYDLYSHTINGKQILFNHNSKKIGEARQWIDDEGEVPRENKTADNVVLNPVNNLPALEIEISVKGSGFEPIDPGIYREFEYIEDIEVFRTTGLIIRN